MAKGAVVPRRQEVFVELSAAIADPHRAPSQDLVDTFCSMISHPSFPCLGARSVLRRSRATFRVYNELGTPTTARLLLPDLREFAAGVNLEDGFASFIGLFRGPSMGGERHFEDLLWEQLRSLHACDDEPWAPGVSADPGDPHFAFSVAGAAFFVVGLHPQASRDARRAPVPALVFNLHEQFEQLRASGGYGRMRDRIRARDVELQGIVNPMLSDHGDASEARQYAGRAVGAHWRADFAVVEDSSAACHADGDAEEDAQ